MKKSVDFQNSAISDVVHRVVSLFLIVALLPIFAVTAFALLVCQGRPIFYRGLRVGRWGTAFNLLKFRTLIPNAESELGARLLRSEDTVVTPLGRVLRKLKVDELPQLLNVLRGEMNLVGPRPVRPVMAKIDGLSVRGYRERFQVLPGMTGLAQLRGGYYCSPQNKARYDLLYIRRRSLLLDLRLVVETPLHLVCPCHTLRTVRPRPIGTPAIARTTTESSACEALHPSSVAA